jgi:hypothetical protein
VPDPIGENLGGMRDITTGQLPDTEVLVGYLKPLADGENPETTPRTLYLDPNGSTYCVIPPSEIRYSQEYELANSPQGFGGTALWVDQGCDISVQSSKTMRAGQAKFLQGGIANSARGRAPSSRFISEAIAITGAINTGGEVLKETGVFQTSRYVCSPISWPEWFC